MKKLNIELITGLFVIIGVLSFTWLAVSVAGVNFGGGEGYTLTARFSSISGLREGAIVEAAGVRVGRVARIDFDPDTYQAVVQLDIQEGVPVQEDAVAAVRTQGIIGEKYIKIIPGGFDELLTDGMEIPQTESAVSLEELISRYIFNTGV